MRVGTIFYFQTDYGSGHRDSHRAFWTMALRPPHQATFENLQPGDCAIQKATARPGEVVKVNADPTKHATVTVSWRMTTEVSDVPVADLIKTSRLNGKVYTEQFAMSFESTNIAIASTLNAQEFDGVDVTHLAGIHNDVVPEIGYLDILVDEMERTDADFLSVVLPIKDMDGKSSVAIDDDEFCVERRITMKEIFNLPPTFTNVDCGYPDRALLVNTGLWLMRFDRPWRLLTDEKGVLKLITTSPDRIKRRPPDPSKVGREAEYGRWEAQHSPADWYLSRYLHSIGCKVMATRKVRAVHIGDMPYQNMEPWGNWDIDEALKHKFNGIPIGGTKNAVTTEEQPAKLSVTAAAAAGNTADFRPATREYAVAEPAESGA